MAAKGKKADYHLRLVQIMLRKNVCKSLWTKCASISNYLIHVMLSYIRSDAIRVARDEPESMRSFIISNCLGLPFSRAQLVECNVEAIKAPKPRPG